jgi:hypothetical protein
MSHRNRWMIALLIIVTALTLAACASQTRQTSEGSTSSPPAKVEHIGETDFSRVILTAQAAKRLDIQTAPVQDAQARGKLRKVVPYAAVFYDLNGATWVYTNPEPLTFVRASISVDYIDGDMAVLSDGPSSGTEVVTVGSPELYGTEFGVGQ